MSGPMPFQIHHFLSALSIAGVLFSSTAGRANDFICLKAHESPSLEEMAVACYSDSGCTYVEDQKGEAIRDYDEASVAAALGREKIEGIVTSSVPIMKQITGYGYSCKPLP